MVQGLLLFGAAWVCAIFFPFDPPSTILTTKPTHKTLARRAATVSLISVNAGGTGCCAHGTRTGRLLLGHGRVNLLVFFFSVFDSVFVPLSVFFATETECVTQYFLPGERQHTRGSATANIGWYVVLEK